MTTPAELLRSVREVELVARKNAAGLLTGNYRTSILGQGLMFHEARKYVFGESIRVIDWNITARMGEPYVRIFEEEREREIFIALDVSPSMEVGTQEKTKMEFALELAATIAVSAVKSKDRLGYLTFSDRVHDISRSASGPRQLFRALKSFVTSRPPGSVRVSDPRTAIHAIQSFRGKHFVVFIISDFIDRDVPDDIRYIRAAHDVSLLQVYDPVEHDLNADFALPSSSPETGGLAPWNPRDTGGLMEMQKTLADQCRRYRLSYGSFSTKLNAGRALREFFHNKKSAVL